MLLINPSGRISRFSNKMQFRLQFHIAKLTGSRQANGLTPSVHSGALIYSTRRCSLQGTNLLIYGKQKTRTEAAPLNRCHVQNRITGTTPVNAEFMASVAILPSNAIVTLVYLLKWSTEIND